MNRISRPRDIQSLSSVRRLVRSAQPKSARRRFATQPSPPSTRTPLILAAFTITTLVAYVTLAPQSTSHEVSQHVQTQSKQQSQQADNSAENAQKRELEREQERAPKPNVSANSAKRHEGHAETNEQKVRKGKFSDVEFDNHITSHSTDPGKDFEVKKPTRK